MGLFHLEIVGCLVNLLLRRIKKQAGVLIAKILKPVRVPLEGGVYGF